MKKLAIKSIMFIMIGFSILGLNAVTYCKSDMSKLTVFRPKNELLKKIIHYLPQKKGAILKAFGKNYKIIECGPEGLLEGFYYEKIGITITFDDQDEQVLWIECNKNVDINGVRAGMSFLDIQKVYGKNKIEETWIETPDNIAYELTYQFKQCTIVFRSFNEKGSNATVFIMPS